MTAELGAQPSTALPPPLGPGSSKMRRRARRRLVARKRTRTPLVFQARTACRIASLYFGAPAALKVIGDRERPL